MMKQKRPSTILTIIVGGNMEDDEDRLFTDPHAWKTHPRNVFYVNSYEQLHRLLSPAKLDLLKQLMSYNPSEAKEVGAIAQKTNRKQTAISRDLHQLATMNLVELKKLGKNVLVTTPFKSIEIQFAQKT